MHGIWGLSPRRRGNHIAFVESGPISGSIPAQAGEPLEFLHHHPGNRVYPRAGGGTGAVPHGRLSAWGLSPRRRGNRQGGPSRRAGVGSIPAQAGEPHAITVALRRAWVYPRAGGGTRIYIHPAASVPGLSPRRRGNPLLPSR